MRPALEFGVHAITFPRRIRAQIHLPLFQATMNAASNKNLRILRAIEGDSDEAEKTEDFVVGYAFE